MRVRDSAGRPLPFARLWSELSIFFMAGMETTGAGPGHLNPTLPYPTLGHLSTLRGVCWLECLDVGGR